MGVMEIKEFKTYEGLACEIVEKMQYVDESITVACFYEDARQIIRELVLTGACTIGCMELHDVEWCGYDDEYYVAIWKYEDEWQVSCESAFNDSNNDYIYSESDICYVMDNCNSRILKRVDASVKYDTTILERETGIEEGICMCPECQMERMIARKEFFGDYYCDDCDEECDESDMDCITYSNNDKNGFYSISFYSNNKDRMKEMTEVFKKFRD